MGIDRANGYSATVEAYIDVEGLRIPLAKTDGDSFFLAERSEVAVSPGTELDLTIIVDGDVDSRPIVLTEGITPGQSRVLYRDPAFES